MSTYARLLIAFAFITFGLIETAYSQTGTSTTDQSTPLVQAKGAHPLGSYGGSDFDRINQFNGNLSMNFPLATLGGRGGTSVTVSLAYNSKFWRLLSEHPTPSVTTKLAVFDEWDLHNGLAPGWRLTAGHMYARHTGWVKQLDPNPQGGCHSWGWTATRLSFVAPDGTEYEFRDKKTGGAAYENVNDDCGLMTFNREQVFETADGTAATFVSTQPIYDVGLYVEDSNGLETGVTGTVYLRDGTQYYILEGKVTWQQDRNGNRVYFAYTDRLLTSVTDTLGRRIDIEYFETSKVEHRIATVTLDRPGGESRVTTIWRGELGYLYADGESVGMYSDLFPGTDHDHDQAVIFDTISSIELPSGHSWNFRYNSHGEVARVETPSRGALEFDTDDAPASFHPTTGDLGKFIFRYVKKRRTFSDLSNTVPDSETKYGDPTVLPSGTDAVVAVERYIGWASSGQGISTTKHYFSGSPLDEFDTSTPWDPPSCMHGYRPWKYGKEVKTEEFGGVGGSLTSRSRVVLTWQQGGNVPWYDQGEDCYPGTVDLQPEFNPRLASKKSFILENSLNLQSLMSYEYDDYNNVVVEESTDWGSSAPGVPLQRVDRTFVTTYNGVDYDRKDGSGRWIHLRSLVLSETISHHNGTSFVAETTSQFDYDKYSGTGNAGLLTRSTTVLGTTHNTSDFGTGWPYRGNATAITAGLGSTDEATARSHYDICGNVVAAVGPRTDIASTSLNAISITYESWSGYGDYHYAFPTKISRQVTEADSTVETLETETYYDLYTGNVLKAVDCNDRETIYVYDDPLDRLTLADPPAGLGQTTITYSGPQDPLSVAFASQVTASEWVTRTVGYDGLGRAVSTTSTDPNGAGLVTTLSKYDGLGRAVLNSNPYRTTGSDSTHGWTRMIYDDQNRVVSVATYDNGPLSPPSENDPPTTGAVTTEYNPAGSTRPTTIVTDQSQRKRKSLVDGLGRLIEVVEPDKSTGLFSGAGSYSTSYGYDARGNLLSVAQGSQTRTFAYDALGRLTIAVQPEWGTTSAAAQMSYTYDEAGNMLTKVDPRPADPQNPSNPARLTTSYTYDEMNRLRTVDYSDTSAAPDVDHLYDDTAHPSNMSSGAPSFTGNRQNPLGHLYAVTTVENNVTGPKREKTGVFYDYDAGGRVTHVSQYLDNHHYVTDTTYNLAGSPLTEQYPDSGSLIENAYNAAGQLSSVKRDGTFATSTVAYAPSGALVTQTLGNGAVHAVAYNSRLQPTTIELGTSTIADQFLKLEYGYGELATADYAGGVVDPTKNNGNVARITTRPGFGQRGFEQNFLYDKLNRLALAREFPGQLASTTQPYIDRITPDSATRSAQGNVNVTVLIEGENLDLVDSVILSGSGVTAGTPTVLTGGAEVTVQLTIAPSADLGVHGFQVHTSDGKLSNAVSFTVHANPLDLPAPTNVTATVQSSARVDVTWEYGSIDELNISGFRIKRQVSGGSWEVIASTNQPYSRQYLDGNCVASTSYTYAVVAYTGIGTESPEGQSAQVTTLQAAAGDTTDDTPAVYDSSNQMWRYRNTNTSGGPNELWAYVPPGTTVGSSWVPIAGEWDAYPTDAPGYYDPTNGKFYFARGRRGNTSYTPLTFKPVTSPCKVVVGDWDGDGVDGVGVYDPSTAIFYLKNDIRTTGGADLQFQFGGAPNSYVPLAGDWDNDGDCSVGLYDAASGYFFLKYENSGGAADMTISYGPSSSTLVPVTGDWDGDGQDSIGLYHAASSTWYLRNTMSAGIAEVDYVYLTPSVGGMTPVVGDWDERPPLASLSPVEAAATTHWTEMYEYDRWGNMNLADGTWPARPDMEFENQQAGGRPSNRIDSVDGSALDYDEAGNVTTEVVDGSTRAFSYDAENRMWQAVVGTAATTYVYDGAGRRVKKTEASGVTTRFIYNAAGALIAEYTSATPTGSVTLGKEYVYGPTGLLATVEQGGSRILYVTPDHLGTPRISTKLASSEITVESRHDYRPFGEELTTEGGRSEYGYNSSDAIRQKFTSYERDAETGLDFAQARYGANSKGRFTSADPVIMTDDRQYDPQQINLYAYCRNNPLAFIDPSGTTISFHDEDSEKAFNEYEARLNKDPEKYAAQIATLKQLRASDVNYVVVFGGEAASETAEGNTVPDAAGENILVRIRNIGGPNGEKLDRNGRFAHEFEHARQFDSGEIAFGRTQDGTWYPLGYDIYDEVNAFNAILTVAPPVKDTSLLRSLRDTRISDGDRARILTTQGYGKLESRQERTNIEHAWGAKPGELVRPTATRSFFGRVYDPSKPR